MTQAPYTVEELFAVTWDPYEGMGATPNNANIAYRGFVVKMLPHQFRKLNPPRVSSTERLHKALDEGKPAGPPTLYAQWNDDHWKVHGHEGRGRMLYAEKTEPNAPIDVHIVPSRESPEMRARHMTSKHLSAPFEADEESPYPWHREHHLGGRTLEDNS